ncbi:PLD nuclease N-terminal domain-containing protein [Pseudoclavibacter helvolus]|uniref:PLD nuclease N-terminal domain-containing protein n=1 Tax=Pseudoclavibacter helvolus TaxID=255205 RepID=UPI003C77233C
MNLDFDLVVPLLPLLVLLILLLGWCLVDLIRRPEVRYLPKPVWALIAIVVIPFGAIAYFILGRTSEAPLSDEDLR